MAYNCSVNVFLSAYFAWDKGFTAIEKKCLSLVSQGNDLCQSFSQHVSLSAANIEIEGSEINEWMWTRENGTHFAKPFFREGKTKAEDIEFPARIIQVLCIFEE